MLHPDALPRVGERSGSVQSDATRRAGGAGLGNTTKLAAKSAPGAPTKTEKKQRVKEVVDPETGEISRFVYNEKTHAWVKAFDQDEALLERWLLQRHAARILSRPQYWQDREKVYRVPYTDLCATVPYCDLDLNRNRKRGTAGKVSKILATELGLPVVRYKAYSIVGPAYSDIKTRQVGSTTAINKAPKFRVVACYRRKVPGSQPELWKHRESGAVSWHKVGVCGSVWTCPICSAKINRFRRQEIAAAYETVSEVEGSAYMLTFTVKHGIGDDLGELLAKFKDAMRIFLKSPAFKEVTRAQPLKRPQSRSLPYLGYLGRIANLEVTHGIVNGWHPHEHHLWFFRRELTGEEINKIRNRLFDAWAVACVQAGLPVPKKTIRVGNSVRFLGLDIRKALSAEEYLTKFGQFTAEGDTRERRWGPEKELAGSHVKAARAKGSTPFQLLYEAAQGDKQAGQRFTEFAEAFLGRHQLQFSRRLKAFLAEYQVVIDETEDGDQVLAAARDEDAEKLGDLTDEQFDRVVNANAQADVLLIAKHSGFTAAVAFIESLPGLDVMRAVDQRERLFSALRAWDKSPSWEKFEVP